jgi:hypothetical protein
MVDTVIRWGRECLERMKKYQLEVRCRHFEFVSAGLLMKIN